MKKVFFILMAFCLCAGLSAQKREGNVITVQGHPHELLTKQAAEGKGVVEPIQSVDTTFYNVYNINPNDVSCTVGCTTVDPTVVDITKPITIKTAYLMVKWTDGKAAQRPGTYHNDSILIWKYQWVSDYTHLIFGKMIVSKYSIDIIRAVANFDKRFYTLLQNTGGGNFAVGAFGYNYMNDSRMGVKFNLTAAQAADTLIKFKYDHNPNCLAPYNQFVTPEDPTPTDLVTQAINAAKNTGVIKHPLDAAYSYPAYDYDYWQLTLDNYFLQWQAGWYANYWAFYVRHGLSGNFTYPTESGIATEPLDNNTVHYFVFASANYNIPVNLNGEYSNPPCNLTYCTNCGQ
jgi:hypothetical protein